MKDPSVHESSSVHETSESSSESSTARNGASAQDESESAPGGLPRPNLKRFLGQDRDPMRIVAVASMGLFVLATFYALSAASGFFIPIVLALLFDRLLSPVVRKLRQVGLPSPVGAGLILLLCVGGIGGGVFYLSGPASEWVETAPRKLRVAEYKLRGLKEPLKKMQEAAEEVEQAASLGAGASEGQEQQAQAPAEPTVSQTLMSQTQQFFVGLVIMIFLLYFLLSSGDLFLRKIVHVLPSFRQRRNAVRIVRGSEAELSRYLVTMVLINVGIGIVVGVLMYLEGMPNPALWGVMAGLLNFVPYLGPLVGIGIVGIVALVTFDTLGQAVIPPLTYFGVNVIEGNFITPTVMGWRLTLNPVAIFIALIFWTWLWGIPGALLAVPVLTTLKIICDNVEVLAPVGVFLGGRSSVQA